MTGAPSPDILKAISESAALDNPDWPSLSYGDFCDLLGVELTPAQKALTLVAYDGYEPCNLPAELREIGRQIFGNVETIPPAARWVVVAVCGGRSGKTYALGALRVLHLALTVSLSTMAPGESAYGLIVAPDKYLAKQAFDYVAGAIESCPLVRDIVEAGTEEQIRIRRPWDGERVTIQVRAASGKGTSLRGRSLVAALLDECAFFRDANYQVNDIELFKAVRPRVLPGGQVLLTSTPWAELGLLYDEFVANHPSPQVAAPHHRGHGKPTRAIAAHAPTLLMRDNAEPIRFVVEAEEETDPINALREFGAQFMSSAAGQYFDAGAISRAIDDGLVMGRKPAARSVVAVGADPGFTSDSATCGAVEMTEDYVAVLDLLEMVPDPTPLKPTVVFDRCAEMSERYDCYEIASDIHYAESAKESWSARGIVLVAVPGGQDGKGVMFSKLRRRFNEGTVRIPNNAKLVRQLREVVSKPTPGGGMSITQPRRGKGGHGDLVSCLVHAVWLAERGTVPEEEHQLEGRDAEADAWQQRLERADERSRLEQEAEDLGMPFVPFDDVGLGDDWVV